MRGRCDLVRRSLVAGLALASAACGGPISPPPPDRPSVRPGLEPTAEPVRVGDRLPAVPLVRGELRIDVVYPSQGQAIETDSTFVYGSVGTGTAELRIDGQPVEVAPNGAFLAFLRLPDDGTWDFEATADGRSAATRITVGRRARGGGAGARGIAPASISPRGVMTLREGEPVTVRFRGPANGRACVVLPDGTSYPLAERQVAERLEGFMQEGIAGRTVTEYSGSFPARVPLLSRDRAVGVPTLGAWTGGSGAARVEVVVGSDTVSAPVDLSLAVLPAGETRTGTAVPTREDSVVIGRAVPGAGTPYHWTFPAGTRFAVTGEQDGQYRVRLTDDLHVWVDARDVRLDVPAAADPRATVATVRLVPQPGWVDVRLETSERVPFRVDMDGPFVTISVYGAETRTNWLQYGRQDPWVVKAAWEQPRSDLYTVRVETADPVWGWRTFWDADGALVVRLRRPPRIDASAPLRGRVIAVDAGHPPGGAVGPTRLAEPEANQAIAKRLVRMIEAAGGRVVETRPGTAAVDLIPRVTTAMAADVEAMVIIHNNAFPDGVNPFESAGTTVFYNQAPSLPFARLLQRELVGELGLRDLGIARADLALSRPTWFPTGYTETMFLMVPKQEAALRDPAVQERIAAAHFRALEVFLRERATGR